MGLTTIIILAVIAILAIVVLKYLVGAAKKIVSVALFILAAIMVFSFLTGNDFTGINGFVTSLLP